MNFSDKGLALRYQSTLWAYIYSVEKWYDSSKIILPTLGLLDTVHLKHQFAALCHYIAYIGHLNCSVEPRLLICLSSTSGLECYIML